MWLLLNPFTDAGGAQPHWRELAARRPRSGALCAGAVPAAPEGASSSARRAQALSAERQTKNGETEKVVRMDATESVEQLPVSTCWSLLRTTTVGRLALWMEGHPEIFPLNFAVDQGTVVFRTGEGRKALGAASGAPVAFEADGYDLGANRAWSVVVKGRARTITELYDLTNTIDLPLYPWHGGDKSRYIRIVPSAITGRRFTVVASSAWRSSVSEVRRASME